MAKKHKKKKSKKSKADIDRKRAGFALGIFWSIVVMFLGVIVTLFNWGSPILNLLSSVYRGYGTGVLGIIKGGLWAFVDGFIGGWVFAYIWNWLGDKL